MFVRAVEAVIFDMDGLLIDTEAVYLAALQGAARTMGLEMPLDFCHSMIGIPGRECNAMIQAHFGPAFALDSFNEHFGAYVEKALETQVPVKAGAVELLDFLRDRDMPLAIATSSRAVTVQRHLGRAGLLDRFKAIATRYDVERGKPHPDVYLEAARRLGVPAPHCVALEDSNPGITAAHAAGTMPIMVPDILPPTPEVRAMGARVVADLHEALHLLRGAPFNAPREAARSRRSDS